MKHSIRRIAVAGTLVAGLLATAAPAAHAAKYINLVGSDTTYFMMDQLARSYNVSAINDAADKDVALNTMPLASKAGDGDTVNKVFPAGNIVPADANCATTIISTNDVVRGITGITGVTGVRFEAPPNGSGSGRTKVLASAAAGDACYDIGRSSSAPGTEAATTEYWAFALDATSWIKFPGNVVTSLTIDELKSIYNCDVVTGAPTADDWSEVPSAAAAGKSGPIKRYIAQSASGLGKTFAQLLNGNQTFLNTNCTGSNLAAVTQENDARAIPSSDWANAIYYYGYGNNYAQGKGVVADMRNKSVLGAITQSGVPVKAGPSTINTLATRFVGTVYRYNIVDTRNPDYVSAIRFVGAGDLDNDALTPVTNGFLCSNTGMATIKLYGYIPLKKATDSATGIFSYCKKNATL